jgi:hypothetical protein
MECGRLECTDNAKHRVAFTAVSDGIINNVMLFGSFFSPGVLHVSQALLSEAPIDLGETFIEENLGRKEAEFKTDLLIVTGKAAP